MTKNIPGDDVPEELNLLNHNDNLGWRGRRVSTRRPKPEIRSTGMAELGIKKNVQFLDELIVHEVPQKAAAYQGFLVCERDPLFVNPIPDATPVQTLYGLTTLIHTARIDGTFARLNEAYRGLGLEHLVGIITTPDRMDAAEKAGDIIVQEYFNTAVCVLPVGTDQIKVVGSAERINDWVQKHGFALVQKKTSHSSKTSARIGGWTVLGLDALSDPAFAEQHIGPHGYDWVIANSIAEHDGWQSEDNFQPATRDSEVRRRPASDLLGVTLEHSLTYTTKLPVTSIPQHAKEYHAFLVASRNVFGDEQQRILYGLRPLAERADIHRLDIENGMQHIIDTGSLPIALFATPEQVSRIADKKKQATSIHRTSRYIRVLPTTTHEITPQGVSHTRVHQDTSALKLVLPRLREPFGKHAIYAADQLDVQLTERYVGGPLDFIIAKELYVPAERVELPVLDSVFSDTDTDFPAIQDTNTTGEQTMTDENQEHRTSDPNMSRANLPADLNKPASKLPGLSSPLGGAEAVPADEADAFSGSDSGAFRDPALAFASDEIAPAAVPTKSNPSEDDAPPYSTGDLFNQPNPFADDPAMQGFSDTPTNSDPLGPLLDTERRTRDEVASASASVVPEADDDGFPNVEIEAEQLQGLVMQKVDPSKPLTTRRLKGRQETMRREAPASTSQMQPALDTDEAVRLAADATGEQDLPELGAEDRGDTVHGAGSTVPPVVKVVVSADDKNITEATLIERPTGRLPAHTMEAGGAVTPADESQTDADAISSDAPDRLARLYQLFEGKFESLEGRMGSLENKVNNVDAQTRKPKKGFMRRTAGLVGKYVVLPATLLAAGVLAGVYIDRHKQTANNVLNETAVPVVQQFEEWTGTPEQVSAKHDPVLAEVAQLRELIAKYDGNKIDAQKLDELNAALEKYANASNLDALMQQQTQNHRDLTAQLADARKDMAEEARSQRVLALTSLGELQKNINSQLSDIRAKLAEDKSEQLAQQYAKLEQTLSTLSANIERTRGDLAQITDSLRQAAQGTQLEQIGKQYEQLAQAMNALTEELKNPTDYTALEERIEGVSKQLEEAAELDRQSNAALNGVAGQQGQVTQALRELSDALRDKLPSAELGQKLDRALALLEQSSQPVQPSNIVTYRGVLQFSDEETHQGAVHFAESLKASRPDSTVTPEFYILLMDARGNKNGVVDMNELKAEILYRLQERNFAYTPGKANVRGTVRRYEQSMGRPSDDLLARVDEVMDTPAWKGFAMETLRQLFEESLDKGYYTTMRVGEKDVLLLTQKGVEIFAQETERRVHRYLSE